jgi:hypothetical protein
MLAVLRAASILCGLPEHAILSKSRKAEIVEARHLAMAALRECGRFSYAAIGTFFNRDHSTVIQSLLALRWRMRKRADDYRARILASLIDTARETPVAELPPVFRGRYYHASVRLSVYLLPRSKPVADWLRKGALDTELGFLVNVNKMAARLAPVEILNVLRLEGGRGRYVLIRLEER